MIRGSAIRAAMLLSLLASVTAMAGDGREQVARTAERQIRQLVEPLLERYCQAESSGLPSCKLLQVRVDVDLDAGSALAPGFDDLDPKTAVRLAPSQGNIKVLIDEKIGPVSRSKLVELVEQYLETLEYPVKVEAKVASFPQPLGSVGRISAMREKVSRNFKGTLEEIFRQFCPDQCMLGDFSLDADPVNPEEAQYGSSGEFVEEAGTALRINELAATVLIDESMSAEEQANLLEMARLRTGSFRNVTLSSKVMRFPQGLGASGVAGTPGRMPAGVRGLKGMVRGYGESLEQKSETTANSSTSTSSENKEQASTTTTNQASSDTRSQSSTQASSSTSVDSSVQANSQETNSRQERFERIEKIERVENGDAVQAELQKFKAYGVVFAALVLSLLGVIAVLGFRQSQGSKSAASQPSGLTAFLQQPQPLHSERTSTQLTSPDSTASGEERARLVSTRYEIERLVDELSRVFAETPRVAKVVFSRILTEEGVETTAAYMQIFGEAIVVDMLRDPSLQSDLNELTEFYARNPLQVSDEEKLDLLRRLHNRTVAGKLVVLGNRSSNLFDFLVEMDAQQIFELVRTESMTVKAIVSTQCDPQKRTLIFQQFDEASRLQLMAELSRIDYLPRDYVFNVAQALKRKRKDNPRLNTEALPGSEVLVGLLERTPEEMQRSVIKSLETSHPDSARLIKGKLVSADTLRYLRDGQLLEVVLSLKHEELLQFLKGAPQELRNHIFAKAPKDLGAELDEELESIPGVGREVYQGVERKILNRMKVMANEGLINLGETNERMFNEGSVSMPSAARVVAAGPSAGPANVTPLRRVS